MSDARKIVILAANVVGTWRLVCSGRRLARLWAALAESRCLNPKLSVKSPRSRALD